MTTLYFQNPTFHKGKNLSVRRGIKWDIAEKKNVMIADITIPKDLFQVDEIQTCVMRFKDLTDAILQYEHDESCKNWDGLLSEMQRVYPGFQENEIVTLVYFNVK